MFRKTLSLVVCVAFLLTNFQYVQAMDLAAIELPAAGSMVYRSPVFQPALIKGLRVHKDNPFLFDFIVDPGQSQLSQAELKEQTDRMIKYFFVSLTLPDQDVWVNLSPYEKDRMIPKGLGVTAMGRDLLAQDYLLKQLTASLIDPQKDLGKVFWNNVYAKTKEMYGTTQVPINTFNKVWILPKHVGIYERGQTAFMVDGHLQVMLEEDYVALTKHQAISNPHMAKEASGENKDTHRLSSQIIRQIILPEIEKEVNKGQNFAVLRQIFYAQALAVWFKHNLKDALLNSVYANKGTVKGIDQNNPKNNNAIYQQYLKAYRKGVFNLIKEDIDPVTQETQPRKYFSGGWISAAMASEIRRVTVAPNFSQKSGLVDAAVLVVTDSNKVRYLVGLANTTLKKSDSNPSTAMITNNNDTFPKPPEFQDWQNKLGRAKKWLRRGAVGVAGLTVFVLNLWPLYPLIPERYLPSSRQGNLKHYSSIEDGVLVRNSFSWVSPTEEYNTIIAIAELTGADPKRLASFNEVDDPNKILTTDVFVPGRDQVFGVINQDGYTPKMISEVIFGDQRYAHMFMLDGRRVSPDYKFKKGNKVGVWIGVDDESKWSGPKGRSFWNLDLHLLPLSLTTQGSTPNAALGNKAVDRGNSDVGGIDLSQEDSAIHIKKDANGGVKVDVNPAILSRVKREGMSEVDPVIIDMRPMQAQSLFS